jgi:class 3 adenylate cyclase/tetratricopeptide (TPR) repeat protein
LEPRERTTETERRRGTVLFVDLTGFTELNQALDTEDAFQPVRECLHLLDGIARKHGGNVDKYLGDCVMAVFGVPYALEDAARAAVNAAIEMHNGIAEFNREHDLPVRLDVHTGINGGLMVSADVSGDSIVREFSVMGHAVNVAARLKDEAPAGQIWIGPETQRAVKDDFELRPLRPLALKGVREPVPAYEVVSRSPQLQRPPPRLHEQVASPLVGRDRELGQLRACLARLAQGEGGIATVFGEAGAGKTRLLAELAATQEAGRVGWFEGRCIATGSKLSFHPFVELLRSWVGIGEGDDDASVLAGLEAALSDLFGDEAGEIIPFLASLMGAPLRDEHRERLAGIEGEAMEKLLVRSLTLLLRRGSERGPLVLVFEDLHWADASSLDLLESLLRVARSLRVLFVLAARPEYSETTQRMLRSVREQHADVHVEVEIEALGAASSAKLIANLFENGDVPHTTRGLIEEKTAGNPFFIEEVVRSLLDDGAIEWREGALWATQKLAGVAIPGSVQEVLMTRIDRLDLATKHVLQIGSVVGRNIDPRILARIVEAESLEAELERLVALQLLAWRSRRTGRELVITHPLIQEVAYETMIKAKRGKVHRQVAEAIEAVLPENTAGLAGMLAYHYSASDEPARAEAHLFQAGEDAAGIAASSEALHFFQEASKLYLAAHGEAGDPAKMAMLEKKIALACYHRGNFIEAASHFDRALDFLDQPRPKGLRAGARFARTLLTVLADLYLPHAKQQRPVADERKREIIEVEFNRARVQTTAAPAEFLFDSMEVLRQLRSVEPATVAGAGGKYAGVIGIFSWTGISFGVGERFVNLARGLVNDDDIEEVILFRLMQFMHKWLMGDWADEWEIPEEILSEALRQGCLWDVANYLGFEADKRIYQGRFREAAERIEEIAKIEDLYAFDAARSIRQFPTAVLLTQQGRREEALAVAEAYATENDEPAVQLLALGTKAEIQILRGELEGAQHTLDRAEAVAAQAGLVVPPFQISTYLRARLLLDVVQLEAARANGGGMGALRRRSRRSGRKALRAAKNVAWERPRVHRLMGTRAWLLGRKRAALRWWKSSLDHAQQLEMKPELGRTYLEVGRRLAGPRMEFDGETPEQCLERARAILSELGLEVEEAPRRPGVGP